MTVTPYPLCWPDGVARTPASKKVKSPFRTGYDQAVRNVIKSLQGFQKDSGLRIDNPVMSSNVDLMGRLNNNDAGVAVWFQMDGQWVAFGVDRFFDAASNIQAIHHIIEARRVEFRYGGLAIVRQTFRAFLALPAPTHWSEILGVGRDATLKQVNDSYRDLARKRHPDRGGSQELMAELNRARDAAVRDIEGEAA